MSINAMMNGARLSYVVRKLEGDVTRQVCGIPKKGEGIVHTDRTQSAGYMVYFPRGHALRIPTMNALKHYGLDRKARIINVTDILADPNSPLGRLISAQTDEERAQGMQDMENLVIRMATAKTGPLVLAEQVEQEAA